MSAASPSAWMEEVRVFLFRNEANCIFGFGLSPEQAAMAATWRLTSKRKKKELFEGGYVVAMPRGITHYQVDGFGTGHWHGCTGPDVVRLETFKFMNGLWQRVLEEITSETKS